jgi:hypothetical protein
MRSRSIGILALMHGAEVFAEHQFQRFLVLLHIADNRARRKLDFLASGTAPFNRDTVNTLKNHQRWFLHRKQFPTGQNRLPALVDSTLPAAPFLAF